MREGDQRVDAAATAAAAMDDGVNLTWAASTESQAAGTLINLLPTVDIVKLAKNNSRLTTAAAKIARACTKERPAYVPRQQPSFSFQA